MKKMNKKIRLILIVVILTLGASFTANAQSASYNKVFYNSSSYTSGVTMSNPYLMEYNSSARYDRYGQMLIAKYRSKTYYKDGTVYKQCYSGSMSMTEGGTRKHWNEYVTTLSNVYLKFYNSYHSGFEVQIVGTMGN